MNSKNTSKAGNGAELLVQCLKEQSVRYIFSIPVDYSGSQSLCVPVDEEAGN